MSLSVVLQECNTKLVSFGGLHKVRPGPDWSLLGVKFKISDEHPRPFYMGVPPPGTRYRLNWDVTVAASNGESANEVMFRECQTSSSSSASNLSCSKQEPLSPAANALAQDRNKIYLTKRKRIFLKNDKKNWGILMYNWLGSGKSLISEFLDANKRHSST